MVRQEFKHLKPDEKAIAQRFVDGNYLQGRYEYDVNLQSADVIFPAHWTKKDLEHWSALRAKRIDIVVHASDAIWIIEVTPKLSKTAVGGCLTYKNLYETEFNPQLPVRLGVVVEVDDLTYHPVLETLNIRLWVV